jgi:hypothetical protein
MRERKASVPSFSRLHEKSLFDMQRWDRKIPRHIRRARAWKGPSRHQPHCRRALRRSTRSQGWEGTERQESHWRQRSPEDSATPRSWSLISPPYAFPNAGNDANRCQPPVASRNIQILGAIRPKGRDTMCESSILSKPYSKHPRRCSRFCPVH